MLQLMHTPQGKSREDLGGPVRSYGWNNVVTLGRRKDNWNNADNLAYFALGRCSRPIFKKKRTYTYRSHAFKEAKPHCAE